MISGFCGGIQRRIETARETFVWFIVVGEAGRIFVQTSLLFYGEYEFIFEGKAAHAAKFFHKKKSLRCEKCFGH